MKPEGEQNIRRVILLSPMHNAAELRKQEAMGLTEQEKEHIRVTTRRATKRTPSS